MCCVTDLVAPPLQIQHWCRVFAGLAVIVRAELYLLDPLRAGVDVVLASSGDERGSLLSGVLHDAEPRVLDLDLFLRTVQLVQQPPGLGVALERL